MSQTSAAATDSTHSDGTLLAGRVTYRQLQDGYRTGIEPVLLAAAVPARPGERVIEGGTGAGAGLLCLSARVAGLDGLGLEINPELASLAGANLAANRQAGIGVQVQDVAAWRATEIFDHAFANPPWHRAGSTPSPSAGRRVAKQAPIGLLGGWAVALASGLRRGGTLSLVLPGGELAAGVAALQAARCPQISVIPLWPRVGQPARLVILRGIRHGAGAGGLLPGLVLHDQDGAYTAAAAAILRDGLKLD